MFAVFHVFHVYAKNFAKLRALRLEAYFVLCLPLGAATQGGGSGSWRGRRGVSPLGAVPAEFLAGLHCLPFGFIRRRRRRHRDAVCILVYASSFLCNFYFLCCAADADVVAATAAAVASVGHIKRFT